MTLVRRTLAATLLTALVISQSVLDRSVTLLLQQHSLKNKMATLNEHISVQTAILKDISDGAVTRTLFIHC